MKIFKLFLFLLASTTVSLSANEQKKPLTHDDYGLWNDIIQPVISENGNWISYQVNPQDGDGILCIYERRSKKTDTVQRGSGQAFSGNSTFIAYRIVPKKEILRQAKLDEKPRDEMPKDSLGITIMENGESIYYPSLKSFIVPDKGGSWMAFMYEYEQEIEEDDNNSNETEEDKQKEEDKETKQENENEENENDEPETEFIDKLVIFNPIENKKHEFENATQYKISENGQLIAFATKECRDTVEINKLSIFQTNTETHKKIFEEEGEFAQLEIDKEGKQLSFVFTSDTNDIKTYGLYYFEISMDAPLLVADSSSKQIFDGWHISPHRGLSFSNSGERLFFGTAPIPEPEPKDTLLDEEKYSLDIWHWKDSQLQPMQHVNLDDEKERSYLAVYEPSKNKFWQMGDTTIRNINTTGKGDARFAVGYDYQPYEIKLSWDISRYRDVYLLDIENREKKLLLEKATFVYGLSPGGNYLIWFDGDEQHWFVHDNKTNESRIISEAVNVPLYREQWDQPRTPPPSGIAGWFEDDEAVLVYDDYDIWQLDPKGNNEPVSITMNRGRDNYNRFRYIRTDREEIFINKREPLLLSVFNEKTKVSGFCHYDLSRRRPFFTNLVSEESSFWFIDKARNDDRIIWRKGDFKEYNDLYISKPDFTDIVKISDANPQQQDYLWGDVQLVEWISFNNDTLQGLLYTPENMKPDKQYPMLVYFYERLSDTKHRHRTPSPSRSVISIPFFTSNGYIVFVPDIPYKIGYPGQSAYDAVVSGTQSMVERYDFIDRNNIGLQGQSWGGYQVAWIITRTDMFKAAMAGTPVSNMFSAYGGIRWSTGMSRQFQYEQTQSRLGGSMWESPQLYYENSPIFFADKIETPLLIMHNDDDGAVPWYQGIELFTALRRLQKPAWMLAYDGEAHNLRRRPNRIDLSIRMSQFFDHYLKGEPAPRWLKYGIPAIDKGRVSGYELFD